MNSANAGHSEFDPNFGDPIFGDPSFGAAPPVELNLAAAEPDQDANPEAWRSEVTARLARFRKRRKPRAPRYPSLRLPFDSAERVWFSSGRETKSAGSQDEIGEGLAEADRPEITISAVSGELRAARRERLLEDPVRVDSPAHYEFARELLAKDVSAKGFSTKIIEFPRAAAIPVMHPTPLADPICDRPRIVEAPEIVPPAPALGGILMEPVSAEPVDRTVRAEAPIASASISERVLAALVDAVILTISVCAVGWIFLHFNPIVGLNPLSGPFALLAAITAALTVVLWMAYEFLFVVATGSTPGLRALGLNLTKFDGSSTDRRIRRWRVLASFLSAFSAGLGYVWCLVDQESLCWHDRITRTHIRSARAKNK